MRKDDAGEILVFALFVWGLYTVLDLLRGLLSLPMWFLLDRKDLLIQFFSFQIDSVVQYTRCNYHGKR